MRPLAGFNLALLCSSSFVFLFEADRGCFVLSSVMKTHLTVLIFGISDAEYLSKTCAAFPYAEPDYLRLLWRPLVHNRAHL